LQHGVQALDGRDTNFAYSVQLVGLEMLDVIQLSEKTLLLWRAEILKFLERLPSQVAAVYQEEHTAGSSMLDKPVNEIAGRECLAATRGHLDKGSRLGLSKGVLKILDGLDLGWSQALLG